MEWTSEALVLGTRPHGEGSVILEVMTAERGRHLGLVKGGRTRRTAPILQPGNTVLVTWRARLDAHLGMFTTELVTGRAARLIESATGVYGIQLLTALLRTLPERDPHPALFEAATIVVDHLNDPVDAGRLLVRFELAVLEELGFALDLAACAATGVTENLVYVSPKSARAVSAAAGAPYRDRLLPLPAFLAPGGEALAPTAADLVAAFQLTGYFLERHVAEPRGEPLTPARAQFIERLRSAAKA
ncbi:DNA repair protein RecO [Chthonobacter rhizosphaerae]|uniref:DNA repair protein RecO n=1 Tax=Chthonobacter rhizosphaerae TaxID=2735553 RepID=UPI0015EF71D7|nr:DNA repair protein RecO [Chthonobacter rhizosphaerae]